MALSSRLSDKRHMATGNNIAQVRKAKGMTQQQVAEKAGVHWITISKLERGKTQLTPSWLDTLSSILEVSPFDLLAVDPLREIQVYGELLSSGVVKEYGDSDDVNVEIREETDTTGAWIKVTDDNLAPFFHRGDMLFFTWMSPNDAPHLLGRLTLLRLVSEGEASNQFGVLTSVDGRHADLRLLNGVAVKGIRFSSLGIMTRYSPSWHVLRVIYSE